MPVPPTPRIQVKLEAGYGRLYVTGPSAQFVAPIPGAAYNPRGNKYELSLTLETLRSVRQVLGLTKEQMARCCTPGVLAFARAAGAGEARVNDMHRLLETGWRQEALWHDGRAGTPAPEGSPEAETYRNDGRLWWSYRPPFDHQRIMFSVATYLDGSAFLCEMGTGKTRAAVEAASYRYARGEVDVTLVLCPSRVMGTWKREVELWSTNLTPCLLEGSKQERQRLIRYVCDPQRVAQVRAQGGQGLVLVLNYEMLYKLEDDLRAAAEQVRLGFVPDEMHKVKNPQAKVTKAAMNVAGCSVWRLGMTGTPITGSINDIWSQWYCVDTGYTFGANFVQFRREYQDENPYSFEVNPKPGAEEAIKQRISRRGLRYRKEDCLDLPPKLYEVVEVDMTRDQRRAYEQMARDLIAILDEGGEEVATAGMQLVMMLRLSQITSGFVKTEDGGLHVFEQNPKADAAEELIRERIADGRSAILWAWYRQDMDMWARRMADLQPVFIKGGQTRADHAEAERRFQARESPLLIANQASGGTGLTLTQASVAAYFSQGFSMTDRTQSEDRCHRAGSQIHTSVTYFDLVCRGTIDEEIMAAIGAKLSLAEAVVEFRRHLEDVA